MKRYFVAMIATVISTGCSSVSHQSKSLDGANPHAHKIAAHRPHFIRDPEVQAEIHSELDALNGVEIAGNAASVLNEDLPGPINNIRLAELELEIQKSQSRAPAMIKELNLASKTAPPTINDVTATASIELKKLSSLENSSLKFSQATETPLIFDIPVTYNRRVSRWIKYFQTSGRSSFKNYLERSSRYMPFLQYELARNGLPQDLAFVAMIESGFQPGAVSHKGAMGMWQIISSTAQQYGLHVEWWVDERKDFAKSTHAAISYITDLYRQFNSWYLVAASYNMGENGVRRLIKRHGTNNFWDLAERGALPQETRDYVPKIIAAMLISKAPALYGFRDLNYAMPLSFEYIRVPGGTDLVNLASYLGVSDKYLLELNPELTKGFVPKYINGHDIRIPKGAGLNVAQYIRLQHGEAASY